MRTKHLYVLIHIRIKGEVGTVKKYLNPLVMFLLSFQGNASFVNLFCYLCLYLSLSDCLVCFLQPCGHQLGKDCSLESLVWDIF